MSHAHVSAVFEDAYFSAERKASFLVALALAQWTNYETGICFPSVESIAKRARASVRGVQEALRQLSADGKLGIQVGAHPSGTNIYRLAIPPAAVAGEGVQSGASPPQPLHHPPQTGGARLHPEVGEGNVPTNSNYPNEAEFVAEFLPTFVSYPDFPAEDYLKHRHSDFKTVGWMKGSRPIQDWRALRGSLAQQYRQDREERKNGSNPNAPRHNGHRTPPATPTPKMV